MLSLVFGAFGLSTLWLIPLFWRMARSLAARRSPLQDGLGKIRFWLGGVLVMVASATLEGLVVDQYTDDTQAGGVLCRAFSHGIGGLLGGWLASLTMLAVLAAALPWYLGVRWPAIFRALGALVDRFAMVLQRGVDAVASRRGRAVSSRRPAGAVRRKDRSTTRPKRAQPAATRRPSTIAAPHPVTPASPPVTASPSSTAVAMTRVRQAAQHEKVIREPWLKPRHAPVAPPTLASRPASSRHAAQTVASNAVSTSMASANALSNPAQDLAMAAAEALPSSVATTPRDTIAPTWQSAAPAVADAAPEPMDMALDVAIPPLSVAPAAAARRLAANDDLLAAPLAAMSSRPPSAAATPARTADMLPPLSLLAPARQTFAAIDEAQLAETGDLIEQRLREFKVPVTVVGASAGPVITRFEVEPAVGVRGNQIVALMKDLARGLGRTSIRVVETIPGKTCMGLELPNEQRQMIALSEILESSVYRDADSLLTLAMGKGITGEPVVADLAKAPHMLVAGTTGSGKSVAVNAMILSMLYKATPDDVRMIMIDPKMLELSVYEGIPHLLAPVVTDMKLAADALAWCVGEMENRYRVMSDLRVRNLAGFNQKVREARAAGRPLMNPFPAHPEVPELLDTLPMIVVVIDELADLMMVAGKKIEELIARLAQKARAAGIHLILATQRPSVDVITGLIKANIPTRVAFQVSSKIDSRTILDQMGAESLLGQGDMLFLPPGTGYPQRIHGAFVADEEVHRVVSHLKLYGEPNYKDEILAGPPSEGSGELFGDEGADAELDPLYDEAAAFVLRSRRASISFVQRQFRIGYNRAARLVEAMEAAGLVSSMGINGQREVIAPGPVD